jgi:arabinofuranosyltransferase
MVAALHAATLFYVTSDDALISLRYSANIAAGHGAVYNPGGAVVEGYSNPLFTFLTAAVLRLGVAPLLAIKLIGLFSLLLLIFVTPTVVSALDGRGSPRAGSHAWFAALFLATSTFSAFWSVAGLETMLHALAIATAVGITMRECTTERVFLSPAAWVLVAAGRPEGAFIAAFDFAAQWTLLGLRAAVPIRWTLLFGLPVAALLGLRFAYYGDIVPNTFHAKVSFGEDSTLIGLRQLWSFTRDGGYLLLVPSLAFVIDRLRVKGLSNAWLIPAATVVAQALFVVLVGGDFMPAYRFIIPVYPLLCALAAAGLASLARSNNTLALAIAALLALALPYAQSQALAKHPLRFWLEHDRPRASYLTTPTLEGTWLEAHHSAAEFIAKHARPGDKLAVTEAGTIPFYAELETIDLLGLNHREIASLMQNAAREAAGPKTARARSFPAEPGDVSFHSYNIASYVLKERPRFIVIDGSFTEDRGDFIPRLGIGRTLLQTLQFAAYHKVFEAKVYDGKMLALGPDRIDVVFELRGSRRRAASQARD